MPQTAHIYCVKSCRADMPNLASAESHLLYLKPLSHQCGVLKAFPQRSKKVQITEVRDVQSPATLCVRCAIA